MQRNPNEPLQQREFVDGDATPDEDEEVLREYAGDLAEEDVFLDADDGEFLEAAPPNTYVNFDQMAENYFARADEIHDEGKGEDNPILQFDDLSAEDAEPDRTPVMEALLHEAAEPLFLESRTNKLQCSIILVSLCTLYSVSHHCLDELLTFLKYDVLPANNSCPKSSYEMKRMLFRLGLSHETIHCCECGGTLYWRENANLDHCPKCQKSRYIAVP